MESVIERFAETHHLRVRKDECGDPVISGRKRHQIFDNGDGRLGVLLVFGSPKKWNNRRKLMTAAGFHLRQDARTEGTALFNPEDQAQSKLAMKITCARPKLALTPEQKRARSARLEAYRRGKAA
jgi:hypothetical protein